MVEDVDNANKVKVLPYDLVDKVKVINEKPTFVRSLGQAGIVALQKDVLVTFDHNELNNGKNVTGKVDELEMIESAVFALANGRG